MKPESTPMPLGRSELEPNYPGLKGIFNQELRILRNKFLPYFKKYGFKLTSPTLCLVDDEDMHKVAADLAQVEENDTEALSFAHYLPQYGVITLEAQNISDRIKRDRTNATLVVAEEIIHHFSTIDSGSRLRVGFSLSDILTGDSGLIAGEIYYFSKGSAMFEVGSPEDEGFQKEMKDKHNLTEAVTALLIHSTLPELLQGRIKESDYPYLVVYYGNYSLAENLDIFMKSPGVADSAIEALISGNVGILAKHYEGKLLKALQYPNVKVLSCKQIPVKEESDFLNF
jgi:hypothetical protein